MNGRKLDNHTKKSGSETKKKLTLDGTRKYGKQGNGVQHQKELILGVVVWRARTNGAVRIH